MVLVLFSQLFIGIVIQMFQSYEGMRSTFLGICSLAFMEPLTDTPDEQRDDMLKELGRISAILYAPELLHFARLGRYQNKIQSEHNGDTQAWASTLVAKLYRKTRKKNWLTSFKHSVAVIVASGKWTRVQLTVQLHNAYNDCNLDCNQSIRSRECIFIVVRNVCKNYDDHIADSILHDLLRQMRIDGDAQTHSWRRNEPIYVHPKRCAWTFVCFASFVTNRLAVFSGLNPDLGSMYVKPSQDEMNELQSMHACASMAERVSGYSPNSSSSSRTRYSAHAALGNSLEMGALPALEPYTRWDYMRHSDVFDYPSTDSSVSEDDPRRKYLSMQVNTSLKAKMAAVHASRSPVDVCDCLGRLRSLSNLDSRSLDRLEMKSQSPSTSPSRPSPLIRATSSLSAIQWERVPSSFRSPPFSTLKSFKAESA